MALVKKSSACCQVDPLSGTNYKAVVLMPRENGWPGAKSESHEIKGVVFQGRVLSVWKETDATGPKAKHWQNRREGVR